MFSGSIHTHSENSMTDSVASVKQIAKRAKELGASAIALTDHGTLTGTWDFLDACKKEGIKGIVGVELYVGNDGNREHLIVLPKNNVGFQAISKAVTASNYNMKNGKPIADMDILQKWFGEGSLGHGNVIATSACIGGVLASVFLSNEIHDKEQNSLRKKMQKESDPSSPLYVTLCNNFEETEQAVSKAKEERDKVKTTASKKYKQRINRAEKNGDEAELERIRLEQEESQRCQAELSKLESELKSKQKELSEIRKRKNDVEKSHEKYRLFQSEIDAIEAKKMTVEQMHIACAERLKVFQQLFGTDNFYIELQYHGYPNEEKIMPILADLAESYDVPVVASNDIHNINREDAEGRAVIFAQAGSLFWKDIEPPDWELYMKTDEELAEYLSKILPEHIVEEAIKNISNILAQCNPEQKFQTHYPKFNCPEGAKARLRALVERGKAKVPEWTLEYQERVEYELSVIEKLGFSDYLCVVEDFLTYARLVGKVDTSDPRFIADPFNFDLLKELGEGRVGEGVAPARGSAAGSLVCYLANITDINPLKYNLLFERFLNPQRVTMPDIDSDIAVNIRQYVIDYVKHKYGENAVCQIMTRGYFLAKNAIRAAGRAYSKKVNDGRNFFDVTDTLSGMISDKMTLSDIEDDVKKRYGNNKDTMEIFRFAKLLEGKMSNIGTHAAGVVISDTNDISDHLPLIYVEGKMSCQCDKERVESLGCLKMDLLGLRNLAVITDCERAIKNTSGESISIQNIPIRDDVFKKIFQTGNTNSVFQFESDGMKRVLCGFGPEKFEDLILLNAVFRPGPLQYIDEITAVKKGEKAPDYVIPEMSEVLDETYGKPVYQEQIMAIFSKFAGFSLGEADIIRRLMSKKKTSEFIKFKERFVNGLVERGAQKERAENFWSEIVNFSEYAFNKSHATAYAFVAYATAYLKLYYPDAYAVGSLNYPPEDFKGTLKNFLSIGVKIALPDINLAYEGFTISDDKIIYGLSSIAGVKNFASVIVTERKVNGPYKSYIDFMKRTKPKKNVIENLIKAGCFDSLHKNRIELLKSIPFVQEVIGKISKKENDLAEEKDENKKLRITTSIQNYYEKLEDWLEPLYEDRRERIKSEREVLGHFISEHPLDTVTIPSGLKYVCLDSLKKGNNTTVVYVSNLSVKQRKSDGKSFASFTAEDKTGKIECVCFTKPYETCGQNIKDESILIVKGCEKYSENDDTTFFSVSDVEPFIEEPKNVEISVPNEESWTNNQDKILPYVEQDGEKLVVFLEDTSRFIKTNYLVNKDIAYADIKW